MLLIMQCLSLGFWAKCHSILRAVDLQMLTRWSSGGELSVTKRVGARFVH
jgi:hypothetical protein